MASYLCSPRAHWFRADAQQAHNCIVEWPTFPQPWPLVDPAAAPWVPPQTQEHTHYHFTPAAPKLSDEDVERIARKVAEILKSA